VRKPSIHFFSTIPAINHRLFDWFVIGDKENLNRSDWSIKNLIAAGNRVEGAAGASLQ